MATSGAQVGALRVNLSLDSANFTQSMQSINRQLKGLNSEFKATAAGNKGFEDSLEGMKAKSENLSKQFKLQEKRVSDLKAEYDQVVKAQGENSKAAQNMLVRYNNAVASMKKTESALEGVNSRIADAEDKWKQFGDAAEKAGEKMKSVGDGMKDVGGKMTAGLTAPLAGFAAAAGKAAADADAAAGQIQAKLGLTAEEAERVNETAQNLWKNGFGEDLNEAANNVATVAQNMQGVDPENLELTAEAAMTVADVMDADVSEVTLAANRLMEDFGLTGTEAFDMITKGAQDGLNRNGDLLDVLNEYSPQFKSLGFTGSEFFETLQAGADAGAFSMDKVGDAVKEFNIRAKDGSDASAEAFEGLNMNAEEMTATFAAGGPEAQKAFQEVVAALEQVEDPVERNKIGVSLFGSQFEDLEADVVAALGTTTGEFENVAGATKEAGDAMYDNFGTRLQGVWRELQSAMMPLGETLLGLAEDVLPVVSSGVEKVSGWFKDMSPTMQLVTVAVGAVAAALGPLIAFLGILISSIGGLIGPITTAIGWLTKLGPAFTIIRTAIAALTGPIGLISAAVIALAVLIYKNWDEIKVATEKVFSAVGKFLKDSWESIKKNVSAALDGIKNYVSTKWQEIQSNTTAVYNAVKAFLSTTWQSIKDTVHRFITNLVDNAKQRFENLKSSITTIFNNVKSFLTNTWNSIKDFISNTVARLRDTVANTFTNLRDRVVSLVTNTKDRAVSIVNSLRDLVTSAVVRTKDNMVSAFNTAKDKVVGVIGTIKDRAKTLWDDIVGGAKELPGRIGRGISMMAENVVSGVKTMINKLASWLGKGVNGAIDGINWVLGKINATKIGKWAVPKYAKGTKGHPGGLAVVGDGGGEELIRTPDGETYLSPATDTLVDLPKGSAVLPHDKTKALLSEIPFYKNGIGDFFKGAWNAGKKIAGNVANFALDIFDYAKNPSGLIQKVWQQFVPNINLGGAFGDIAKNAVSFLGNKAISWVTDKLKQLTEVASGQFGPPFRLTSKPGMRYHPKLKIWRPHNGYDYAAPYGTPIPSQTAGTVKYAGYHHERGNYVRIGSGKYDYIYQHNARNLVRNGQSVSKGQIIGTVGSTGLSTGPHLHFEKIKMYANGGIVKSPTMGMVGEAGPEGIIPLSLNKRGIALDLWGRIGEMIGAFDTRRMERPSGLQTQTAAGAASNINLTLNYSGSGSEEDARSMVDIIERELASRSSLAGMMRGGY